MPELDAFERSLEIALREYAERGVVPVDADDFAARVAPRTGSHLHAWLAVRRRTWLLLMAALLSALLASALLIGGQPTDERAVLLRTFEPRDVGAVTVSPDGDLLAVAEGADLLLLDLATSGVRTTLPAAKAGDSVWDIAFSPDAGLIAAVSGSCGSAGARVRVWDVKSGDLVLQRLDDFEHMVTSVAFSPDGARLAVGTGCAFERQGPDSTFVKVWDIASGAQLLDLPMPDFVEDVAFSPDGNVVATAGREEIISLWDVATGAPCGKLRGAISAGWSRLTFSPDGTRLASAGDEALVWDLTDGGEPYRLEGITADLHGVVFSPDGRHVIGCRGDAVLSWDALSGELMTEVSVDRTAVGAAPGETHPTECSLAIQDDDLLLVTYGWGHDVRLWRVPKP